MNGGIPNNGGKNLDLKKVMEWLGLILRCPICSFKYNFNNTQIIDSQQNDIFNEAKILIHSDCKKCKSSVIFNVEIKGPEVFSVGMVTDLTGSDSGKFKNRQPISTNEVIGIHKALKEFKGDFISSFTLPK